MWGGGGVMGITSTCKGRLSNTYSICILKSAENYTQNLITIFSQNIQSFEQSFQIILGFLNTDKWVKKARLRLVFSTSLSVFRIRGKTLTRILNITSRIFDHLNGSMGLQIRFSFRNLIQSFDHLVVIIRMLLV